MVYLILLLMIRQWPLTIKTFVGLKISFKITLMHQTGLIVISLFLTLKSNVILIGPKSKVMDHTVFITLNGIQIQQSKEITLIGLQIDNILNFHSHINALAKKLSSKVGLLLLRLVNSNRLVNLGISKQQHLYLKTKNLI